MSFRKGVLTTIAARAMAPGVIVLSLHLIPEALGPERLAALGPSDEGPNNIIFNTYVLLVRHVRAPDNRVFTLTNTGFKNKSDLLLSDPSGKRIGARRGYFLPAGVVYGPRSF